MNQRMSIWVMMAVGLATITLGWTGPAFSTEQVKLLLHRAQGATQGSGEAVIVDGTLTTHVKDLKPHSIYTVWFVNTDPKHEMAGVGQAPYMFKTNGSGAGTFKAKLEEQPFGMWQMLVIIRHPNGNPQDMQHVEDALWAGLARASKSPTNPCAAR